MRMMGESMYLKTKGKPLRVPVKLCKDATKWYAHRLLGSRLYHNIEVELHFTNTDMDDDVYAYCDWNDSNYKARDFTITVRKDLSKKQTLLAIAHEMVHVKQYAKGELYDLLRSRKCKWQGEVYESYNTGYWNLPWEIEAHRREKILYGEFMRQIRG
jgi:hypothetical protein